LVAPGIPPGLRRDTHPAGLTIAESARALKRFFPGRGSPVSFAWPAVVVMRQDRKKIDGPRALESHRAIGWKAIENKTQRQPRRGDFQRNEDAAPQTTVILELNRSPERSSNAPCSASCFVWCEGT